jgi:excisionase family DNA binding protein
MSQEPHVSVHEAARLLDRSTEQVRRYLREGRLTGRRIGGQWFIDRAELDTFQRDLHAPRTFLQQIAPAGQSDPLGATIGIGSGGKSNIAQGKAAYRERFRWRRSS